MVNNLTVDANVVIQKLKEQIGELSFQVALLQGMNDILRNQKEKGEEECPAE